MNFRNFLAHAHYLNNPYLSGIATLCLFFMGLFIYLNGKRAASNRIFSLMMWCLAIWFFSNTMSMLTYKNLNTAFLWFQIGYTAVPFISVAGYHYYHAQYGKRKRIILLLYIAALVEALLVWSFLPSQLKIYALPNVGVVFQNVPGTLIFWLLVFGMAKWIALYIITTISFFREYKQETQPLKRQQLKLTAIVFLMFTVGALEWLAVFGIPLHIGWVAVIGVFTPMTYAITRYRLMDINLIISHGLAGVMFLVIFGMLHLGLFNLFNRIVNPNAALLFSLAILAWIFFFSPLWPIIRRWTQKIVLKGKYDYQEILREATNAVVTILDLEELIFYLIDMIRNSLNVTTLAVLLKNESKDGYVLRWADGIKPDLLGNYVIRNGIVDWIERKKTVFIKEEQSLALSRKEFATLSKDIEGINAEIIVPLFYKGYLEGLLALDNKATREPYMPSDITLLDGLASQAIIAIKNAQLYEEAITDSLTGLFHHKYFMLRAQEEMDRARRYRHSLGLIMIDLDKFKSINDSFGHQTGDAILVKIAQILKKNVRKSDIVCRYGGEEFCLILPELELRKKNDNAKITDRVPDEALAMAERLRKTIEKEVFQAIDGEKIKITISLGIAYMPDDNNKFMISDLIERADKALYLAKQNGRNRIEVWGKRLPGG